MEEEKPMSQQFLKLQPSELAVAQSAATIFAAYIATGKVSETHQSDWMDRAVREAIEIAYRTDRFVRSDDEAGGG